MKARRNEAAAEREATEREKVCNRSGPGETKSSLQVMQWNCDSILSKAAELRDFLGAHKIDVALIQESKLREEDNCYIEGYNMVRKDRRREGGRRWARGGGVVTLIREGLHFQEVGTQIPLDGGIEAQRVQIWTDKAAPWNLVNVYIPPETSFKVEEREMKRLVVGAKGEKRWLVAGDFNAHHGMWDNVAAGDNRGEWLAEWAEESEMVVLNEGDITRRERGTGRLSTPDVTFCSSEDGDMWDWRVVKQLNSDHYPIKVSCRAEVTVTGRRTLTWAWKKADWIAFQEKIRTELPTLGNNTNVMAMEKEFRTCVLTAAHECIGMRPIGTRNMEYLSEEVRAEMAARDRAREGGGTEQEIAEMDARIREQKKEDRRKEWRNTLEASASYDKMWRVVKKQCKETGRGGGEVLMHNGRAMATPRAKADAYCAVYAEVSRLTIPKESRCVKRQVIRDLKREGPVCEEGKEFGVEEVRRALGGIDGSRAAGPDGIHPKLLRNLPEEALPLVTRLFNSSFATAEVPQKWRDGIIVPILKGGKDPSDMGSYRPVCLTSCMSKWLERVVADRVRHKLETSGGLSDWQAGFRAGRSVEDQLVRLSQEVDDGFQLRKKTVLALYDFSRAYDTVWRFGLYRKMIDCGLPSNIIRWVARWMSNRRMQVRVQGVLSKTRIFKQGLPQGAVLSPLIFLVYINDLIEKLSRCVQVSGFADDLAVWHVSKSVEEGEERVQQATEMVEEWSRRWLMKVAGSKCSVTLFSMDVRDSNREVAVTLRGEPIANTKRPVFLGVMFDQKLTFGPQVDRVCEKAKKRVKMLRMLGGSTWGWNKELMRTTYTALIKSVLLYGVCAWGPWAADSNWMKIERVQLEAGRAITGLLASSPSEAILAEMEAAPVKKCAEAKWATLWERALRQKEGDPRRELATREVRQRLVRRGWRIKAEEAWKGAVEGEVCRGAEAVMSAPWVTTGDVEWVIEGGKTDDPEANRKAALDILERDKVDVTIYTDGSAHEGRSNGGSACVVTSGSNTEPVISEVRRAPGGSICSSFQAEMKALGLAVGWLTEKTEEWQSARIVTDSRASMMAIQADRVRNNPLVDEVKRGLHAMREKKIIMVWVPSHCGIAGNEAADAAADEACGGDQAEAECLYEGVKRRLRTIERKGTWEHRRCQAVYSEGVASEKEEGMSREELVELRRFRAGHSMHLKGYQARIGQREDSECRRCGEEAEKTEHVWRCPAGEEKRRKLGVGGGLGAMARKPREAAEYWQWFRRRPPDA